MNDQYTPSHFHGDIDARDAVLDFAVNVVSPTPPRFLASALRAGVDRLGAYPDARELAQVEAMIAAHHNIPSDHVMLLAGASEGFAMLPKLLHARGQAAATVVQPGFSEPEIMLAEAGIRIDHHVLTPPFADPRLSDVSTSVLVIGNPCNPTGVLTPATTLRDWATAGSERLLVVDEAFIDATPSGEEASMVRALRGQRFPESIVVLRSLTKTWSLAGLRVGYAIASPQNLAYMRHGRAHWPLSTLQILAARTVMEHLDVLPKMVGTITAQRTAMREALLAAGFQIETDSQAPYLLVRPPGPNPEALRRSLLAEGIAVRRCDTFPGLGEDYWRLAVRDQEKVAALIDAVVQHAQN